MVNKRCSKGPCREHVLITTQGLTKNTHFLFKIWTLFVVTAVESRGSGRVGDMKEGSSREWWSDFCDRDQQRMHHWDVLQLSSGAASGSQSQFISQFPAKTRWRGNIKMAHAQSALQQVGRFTTKAPLQQFMKKMRGKICTIPALTISQRIPQGCPQ